MSEESNLWDKTRTALLWFLVPLLLGALIAAAIPQPTVGVIYLNDAIYSTTARDMITQLTYARENASVRAVVIVMESPGGTVADTEAVYLEMLRLRETKPIIVSVGTIAASGAYYLSAGADYVFVAPTSMVGNIGVIGYLPQSPTIYTDIVSTGPYKLFGAPRDQYTRQIDMIKDGFYQAVRNGRGTRLNADAATILSGAIWNGNEAVRMGLVDAIGSPSDAIAYAAEQARIANYATADLRELAGIQDAWMPFFYQTPEGVSLPYPREAGIYLLYIPPAAPQK
jgi:protease IV